MKRTYNHGSVNRSRCKVRFVVFRIGAILVVLLPLVLIEAVLRIVVPAPAFDTEDPYVSFSGVKPLFVLDSEGNHYQTDRGRLTYFRPQSFSAEKDADTFRVFCLGGSTVQGRPYSVETAFGTWLQLNLHAADATVDWEVINCGGISYASYRLLPVMRELLQYEPDLFIICTGHNEFLEDRTYQRLKKAPRFLVALHRRLLNLRSYSLADRYLARRRAKCSEASRTVLPAEVKAKLDYQDGLQSYHRDDIWRAGMIEHFSRNIETMVRIGGAAGAPVIFVNQVSNLKDSPPFKSEFSVDGSRRRQVVELWQQAADVDWSDIQKKTALLEAAAQIDARHAGLLYLVGKCYERMGRMDEAKKWFLRAKEQDVCPLRVLDPMRHAIAEIAARYGAPIVDAEQLITECTGDGIPGDEWLLDHVHPTIAGHQLIAESLFEKMQNMRLVRSEKGWRRRRDDLWLQHISSLSEVYYAKGAQRLKRLQEWSQGRIPKAPPAKPDSPED